MNITNIKENMGTVDRVVRAIAATVFVASFFYGLTSGVIGLASLAVSVVFLATGVFGFCPIYSLLGLHSNWKHVRVH